METLYTYVATPLYVCSTSELKVVYLVNGGSDWSLTWRKVSFKMEFVNVKLVYNIMANLIFTSSICQVFSYMVTIGVRL